MTNLLLLLIFLALCSRRAPESVHCTGVSSRGSDDLDEDDYEYLAKVMSRK